MGKVNVLMFGGCNLRTPLVRASSPRNRRLWKEQDWRDVPRGYLPIGPLFYTYTLNEMLQGIACYRGEASIPEEYHSLCNMKPNSAPHPGNSPLDKADVVIAEPNTSHDIILDGIYVSRRPVGQLLDSIKHIVPQARHLPKSWFERGIVAMDEDARRTIAEELLAMIPETVPRFALIEAVLRRARGAKSNPKVGLERLAKSFDCPLGIVTYTWAYMPDGRALSWPVEFYSEMLDAAGELGLPVFEPRYVVEQAGVPFAVEKDLRHYKDEFIPVIAKPIVEFTLTVASCARSGQARPRRGSIAVDTADNHAMSPRRRMHGARRSM